MRIIVLFNLKPGADVGAYENWARTTDIPGVRAMGSVNDFRVLKVTGLLGTDAPAPYEYVEEIDVKSLDPFLADASTSEAQQVAEEFQAFADNPVFMLTEEL